MKWVLSILALRVALALPASLLAASPASVAPLLQPFVDRHELAGAVALVVDKEKVLAAEAVGFADIGGEKSMMADSVFWIASQSKPITATAVMMLVDEGKIAPDDTVEKHLPEFRGQMVVAEKDGFGHGGAHATNMEIRRDKGVALVWMVQHGGFPGDGGRAHGVFKNWALERFGK